ncbi:hypothetical protein D3P08_11420 [Paenibacillus nanensis]|uniref:Right handed beta helix domain-containing protein n=1 Tax=Paenibacillus nanensis TaxID=393251 RepID=A0A3A1UWP9_9BACL|nr:hypothetical protein D3P08_11420 [Paenibacillus nanensis]
MLGINNALKWAVENNFDYIILPKNQYAICYPNPILIAYNHITLDFHGSTLKVIYDSDSKSPFDPRPGATDYFNYPGPYSGTPDGVSIVFRNANHSHVKNAILIGCKADRSFSNAAEAKIEWTHGIQLASGSAYCSVSHCTISSYMGDGVNINSTSPAALAGFSLGLTANEIDPVTGALIPSTNQTMVSKLIDLPSTPYDSMLISGFGYTRVTALNQKEVDVIYYNASNGYLSRYSNKKIYTPISIPPDARKFRLLFRNETDAAKNMQFTIQYGLSPHHNTIEFNEIYNTHRGGILLGGNYNIIRNNSIHDGNGLLDRKPLFPSTTRYGINQEDAYGDHSIVRDNLLYNLNHGILLGCWSADVYNNLFYNLTGNAVNLYVVQSVTVRQNQMYRCQAGVGIMTTNLPGAHVVIENNNMAYITNQTINGVGYEVYFERNVLIDVNSFSMPDDDKYVCRENRFIWTDKVAGIPFFTVNRTEYSVFIGLGVQREIYSRVYEHIGSIFQNMHLRLETRNQSTKTESVTLRDCNFFNSLLSNRIYATKSRHVSIQTCKLADTVVKIGNINTPDFSATTSISDSKIIATTVPYMIQNESNTGYGWVEMDRSVIEINNTTFNYFVTNVYAVANTASIILKNSTVSYTGTSPYPLPSYYEQSKKTAIRTFVNSRNRFVNIVLPQGEAGRYLDYDPAVEGLQPPVTGYWFRGDTYKHAAPAPGGYAGWICISSGYASAASWKASTAVRIGDQIQVNGRVYEAMTSGTTGASPPAWPTAPNATQTDNTVTWRDMGSLAQFRRYAPISEN